MHVKITSVENILHYFDTPKPQGGKPGFEMKFTEMELVNSQ